MKRYFISGQEITEAEAKEIERRNAEYLNSCDMNDLLKIKFIVVI